MHLSQARCSRHSYPSIQQIAAFAARAAAVCCCLRGGGGVIDDPQFVKGSRTHHDLIARCVVINRVHVNPVTAHDCAEVDVDEFRVRCDNAEVCGRCIRVLNEVIPHTPTPRDVVGVHPSWMHFDYALRVNVACNRGAAGSDGFSLRVQIPHDAEDIAVGQRTNIVMLLKQRGCDDEIVREDAGW